MRSSTMLAFVISTSFACGGARPAPVSPVAASVAPASASEAPRSADGGTAVRRVPGPLTRAEATALVARGLGAVLARIDVSPQFDAGRFVGYRLDGARDLDDWRSAGADVRIGDVITRVNGIRVERPEQALWAFERLRIASVIEVQLLREGSAVTVRSPIVGGVPARTQE